MAFSEEEVPPGMIATHLLELLYLWSKLIENPKAYCHAAPRTPTTYRDHIESHDLKSTGRRLFPKRRLTLSQFATVNPRNSPDFGPTNFLVTPASDLHAHEAQGRYTSASSINTVKRHISPAKSWDSPYTDAGSGDFCRDQTPCKSVSLPLVQRAKRNTSLSLGNSCPSSSVSCAIDGILCPRETSNTMMEAAFTAPLYSKAPARRYLEWKSVREFHKNRVAGVFGSSRTWPRRGILPPGIPEGLDQTYQNATIQRIVTWDCSVEICTAARISALGTVQVYHHAVISVTVPNQEVYAKRTRFSMIMMNGLRDNQTCRLAPGQSSLIFREEISTSQASYEDEAEITIERESCDLEKPIHLYLLFNYPSHRYYVIASLPTFRPQEGRVLYENVIIAKYIPPLQITPLARSGLSSWKFRDDPVNRSTFIERSEDPRFYTERLRDDIQVKIMELSRVHFPLLAGCYLSDVAWKLDIVVQKVLGAKLQCRMSFFLVVGEADAVVSIVPYGWIPTFFVVNGRLANEKEGEWRQTEDGRLILFRQPHMCPGPIRVETCWHEPLTHDIDNGSKPSDLFLPVVADRKVLGGVLICKLNNSKSLDNCITIYILTRAQQR